MLTHLGRRGVHPFPDHSKGPHDMKHSLPRARRRTSTRTKALVTGGLVALTVAGVGGAAFASFTGTTSASQSIASGTVTLAGIGTNAAGNRLTVGASNIAAGDTIQRAVTVTNTGTIDLASITLTTNATTSSLLNTDTVTGLQMTIDKCSIAWTESAIPYTYTCGGTTSSVLASSPVIGTGLALSNLGLTAAAANNLRVTLTLPSGAGNTLQGLTSVINYTFTGTQRAAAAQ
jgi:spore coat-associated protein N